MKKKFQCLRETERHVLMKIMKYAWLTWLHWITPVGVQFLFVHFRSKSGIVSIYDRETALLSRMPKPLKHIKNLTTRCSGLLFNSQSEILAIRSKDAEKAIRLVSSYIFFFSVWVTCVYFSDKGINCLFIIFRGHFILFRCHFILFRGHFIFFRGCFILFKVIEVKNTFHFFRCVGYFMVTAIFFLDQSGFGGWFVNIVLAFSL